MVEKSIQLPSYMSRLRKNVSFLVPIPRNVGILRRESRYNSVGLKRRTTNNDECCSKTFGENIFKINVTAEDGTKKEYKLIIKREKGIGTVTITKFSLGNNDIEFDNNKATVNVLYGETINDYSYELSDKNAKLKLYINNKEVSDISDVKGNDEIKLVVIDEDDNELIYIIKITEDGPIISAIINIVAYSLVIGILVAPIIIIILVVKNIKKKIKK